MRSFLVRHWFLLAIALIVGLALFFPQVLKPIADFWKPRPTVAISLFLMAWTMPTRSILEEVRRPFASIWAVLLSYVLVPPSAWLLGLLGANEEVQVGLVLVASV